jgi:hypothetical protein
MLRRVVLVTTDVSDELRDSIIRMTRIGELGKLAVTSNRRKLRRYTLFTLILGSVRRLLVTAIVPS